MSADGVSTAARLVAACAERSLTVATAESLTAGACAAAIADVAGASAVLRGGLITYDVALKTSLAGVDAAGIARHGVVSTWTAAALARGAARMCGARLGLGLTGVAGPDAHGGREPGTVCFGVVLDGGAVTAEREFFGLDRAGVRAASVEATLALALDVVTADTGGE